MEGNARLFGGRGGTVGEWRQAESRRARDVDSKKKKKEGRCARCAGGMTSGGARLEAAPPEVLQCFFKKFCVSSGGAASCRAIRLRDDDGRMGASVPPVREGEKRLGLFGKAGGPPALRVGQAFWRERRALWPLMSREEVGDSGRGWRVRVVQRVSDWMKSRWVSAAVRRVSSAWRVRWMRSETSRPVSLRRFWIWRCL